MRTTCFGMHIWLFFLFCSLVQIPIIHASEYEGYYTQMTTYPYNRDADWTNECQGVTTDGRHWFFVNNSVYSSTLKIPGTLYKVPLTLPLSAFDDCDDPGVDCKDLFEEVPELGHFDYNHVGDISFFEYVDTQGTSHKFIFAPFEHTDLRPLPAIAVFDADTLDYIAHAELPEHVNGKCPWVALDPNGSLYSGRDNEAVGVIYKYEVDWNKLVTGDPELIITPSEEPFFSLLDEDGNAYLVKPAGAVFSESGHIFFISGYHTGIDAFDIQTRKRIRHIKDYKYENEGCTILDVDSLPLIERPPGISGQLHVVHLHNEALGDNVYFDHFSNKIYVNANYTEKGSGKPSEPFQTITEANNFLGNGMHIIIKGAQYNESATFHKKTLLLVDESSTENVMIIGQ